MRYIKVWAALALLTITSAASFMLGRNYEQECFGDRTYRDACRMSDLIRCYQDHLEEDSLIEDYGCFDELQGIFLYDDALGDRIDLSSYMMTY